MLMVAGNVTVWHRAGNEFRAAYRWWHRAALVFLPFLISVFILPPRSWRVREGEKLKGERTGSERLGLRGAGNSVQHGACWRR